jgi:hypothetical protein
MLRRTVTVLFFASFCGLSFLPAVTPGGWWGALTVACAVGATAGFAVTFVRLQRPVTGAGEPVDDPAGTAGRVRDLAEPSPLRHLSQQRRTLDAHPIYGLPLVVVNAALIGTLHWWAILALLPLDAWFVWAFFWPGFPSAE